MDWVRQDEEGSQWLIVGKVAKMEPMGARGSESAGGVVLTVHSEIGHRRRLEVHRLVCWEGLGRDVLAKVKVQDKVGVAGFIRYRVAGTALFPKTLTELAVRRVALLRGGGVEELVGVDPSEG